MNRHDPYTFLLDALNELNDLETDEQVRQSLKQSRSYVKRLREAYEASPCVIDYSDQFNRAAYLFAYYPHYIEILYHVLCEVPTRHLTQFDQRIVRGCFLGAGPGPEVLGLLAFLGERFSTIECFKAYLFDKYVNHWRIGQDITRYHLAPRYCPNKKLIMRPIEFDLQDYDGSWTAVMERCLKLSNVFVMQNAINDQLHEPEQFLDTLVRVFEQINPGSIFVMIDVNFKGVQEFMNEFGQRIVRDSLGDVVLRPSRSRQIESNIVTPQIIFEELLTGDDRLIPKKYTKFFSAVFIRN